MLFSSTPLLYMINTGGNLSNQINIIFEIFENSPFYPCFYVFQFFSDID